MESEEYIKQDSLCCIPFCGHNEFMYISDVKFFNSFVCLIFVMQVKILRDEVKGVTGSSGKSRGAAFVEFAEHQHALVALRVLNNNPGANNLVQLYVLQEKEYKRDIQNYLMWNRTYYSDIYAAGWN